MKSKEFLQSLADIASALRANIEAHCTGWDDDPKAVAERVTKVCDPVSGYEYFVKHYFPHYIRHKSQSELHKYLFKRLPEMACSPNSEFDANAASRGEAKSTLVDQLYTLWRIVVASMDKKSPIEQLRYALIVMDSIDQAYPMLEAIKAELEVNPRLKIDFPKAFGAGRVWQSGTIVTANDIKVQVAGAGKKLRGLRHGAYRPNLVILDDIENDENVRKPEQRDKLHNWLKKTIMALGTAGEKLDIIYIGTILHHDSVLARTLKNPAWRSMCFRAIIRWPDNMHLWDEWLALFKAERTDDAERFYIAHQDDMEKGAQVSWAARPLLALMKIRARDGNDAFDSEYQNDPTAGEDAPFNNAIRFWSELPNAGRGLVYFGAVDPSLGKHGASRDPSAILVGAFERATGRLYVVEASIKKRLPDRIIEDIIAMQAKYQCMVWAVEAVQFQEFLRTELIKRSAARGVPVPARAVMPHSDKLLRIESLQPHMQNGLILLHHEQNTLIDQFRHFPKADHDDGPDCLHMLWATATSHAQAAKMQPIQIPQPSIYY